MAFSEGREGTVRERERERAIFLSPSGAILTECLPLPPEKVKGKNEVRMGKHCRLKAIF